MRRSMIGCQPWPYSACAGFLCRDPRALRGFDRSRALAWGGFRTPMFATDRNDSVNLRLDNPKALLPDQARDEEIADWLDALDSVEAFEGLARVDGILDAAVASARRKGAQLPFAANTAYVNTISPEAQPPHPGNLEIEARIRHFVRWNDVAMVLRANKVSSVLWRMERGLSQCHLRRRTGRPTGASVRDPLHRRRQLPPQGSSGTGRAARRPPGTAKKTPRKS